MATLQASLLFKPSLSPISSLSSSKRFQFSRSSTYPNNHNPLPISSHFLSTRFRNPGGVLTAIFCALQPESANLSPESVAPEGAAPGVSGIEERKAEEASSWGSGEELEGNAAESEGKGGALVAEESRLPLVVFLMGLWARVREGFEKILMWDWLSWWPFWRQEKRLERLIAEADANPMDAAKQNALLAELNKQRLDFLVCRIHF